MGQTEFIECTRLSNEHVLRFEIDDNELYTSVFLCQYRGFLKRMCIAIKYLFGYKCKDGHWDCTIINPKDVDRLITLLLEYKVLIQKPRDNS